MTLVTKSRFIFEVTLPELGEADETQNLACSLIFCSFNNFFGQNMFFVLISIILQSLSVKFQICPKLFKKNHNFVILHFQKMSHYF